MGCSLHPHWQHPHCTDCMRAIITGDHAPDFSAQLAERDAIIDEARRLLGEYEDFLGDAVLEEYDPNAREVFRCEAAALRTRIEEARK